MGAPRLTARQHDSVLNSPVGQYLDRLIREDGARGNKDMDLGGGGTVIQQLWEAFHPPEKK
jgi:hypothetical protein